MCEYLWFFLNLGCGDMWCTSKSVPENLGYISFAWNDFSQWNDDLMILIMHLKGKGRKKKPSKSISSLWNIFHCGDVMFGVDLVVKPHCPWSIWAFPVKSSKTAWVTWRSSSTNSSQGLRICQVLHLWAHKNHRNAVPWQRPCCLLPIWEVSEESWCVLCCRPQNTSSRPTSTGRSRRSRSSSPSGTGWTPPFTSRRFAPSGCCWTSYLKQICEYSSWCGKTGSGPRGALRHLQKPQSCSSAP